jgi:hypothetical protein
MPTNDFAPGKAGIGGGFTTTTTMMRNSVLINGYVAGSEIKAAHLASLAFIVPMHANPASTSPRALQLRE